MNNKIWAMGIIGRKLKNWLPKVLSDNLEFLYPSSIDNRISKTYRSLKRDSVIHTNFGFKMYIDYSDHVQYRYLYWDMSHDEVNTFKKLVDETNGDLLDIGANVGFYSLFFCKFTKTNRSVHSFEPVRYNINRLKKNLSLNGYDNVNIHEFGLSDKTGQSKMVYSDENRGGASMYRGQDQNQEYVEFKKLDEVEDISHNDIGFVKIDVEGAELSVLKGGAEVFKNNLVPLLIEVHPDAIPERNPVSELVSQLGALNYNTITNDTGTYNINNMIDGNIPDVLMKHNHWIIK